MLLAFLVAILAQQPAPQLPPEEDESLKPRVYDFNPLKAAESITAGNFYFKKGNFHAAASRYQEATLYDPGSAEAFLRLGEASEKVHDFVAARDAFHKYLELAKNAKDADAIKKRMEKYPPPPKK